MEASFYFIPFLGTSLWTGTIVCSVLKQIRAMPQILFYVYSGYVKLCMYEFLKLSELPFHIFIKYTFQLANEFCYLD